MIEEIVGRVRNANAFLSYILPSSGASGDRKRIFYLWVTELAQPHELAGQTFQSQSYQHFYPKSYMPGIMAITGRARTQAQFTNLGEFIRAHQQLMISSSGASNVTDNVIPLMDFGIPEENIYVTGWSGPFQAGAKRFNPAPEWTINFEVVSDRHSTNDKIIPSRAKRGWWTGEFIDNTDVSTATDIANRNKLIRPNPIPGRGD